MFTFNLGKRKDAELTPYNEHRISKKVKLQATSNEMNREMASAIKEGDCERVKLLMESGNLNINSMAGSTALHIASFAKQTEIFKLLLTHPDIDINASSFGSNVLHAACNFGVTDIVKLLLANPYLQLTETSFGNTHQETALDVSCLKGHLDIVKLLLDTPLATKEAIAAGLTTACKRGHVDVVKHLLELPAVDPNCFSNTPQGMQCPIIVAVENGRLAVVEELLTHPKIDINCATFFEPPIIIACKQRNLPMVKLLTDRDDLVISKSGNQRGNPLFAALYATPQNSHIPKEVATEISVLVCLKSGFRPAEFFQLDKSRRNHLDLTLPENKFWKDEFQDIEDTMSRRRKKSAKK